MKKYVVVIPVRKEAYVKEFSGRILSRLLSPIRWEAKPGRLI